ncbi:MAG: DNA adenine methylase [Verrucomicrobiota bacterium]
MSSSIQKEVKRPPLRYFGGKFLLAPWVLEHVPEHRGWVEPFGGGAGVLLRKTRAHSELYNDLDGEIVNFFKQLRDRGQEFVQYLELTPFSREAFEDSYRLRDSEDPFERAAALLIRNQFGFGSSSQSRKRKTGFRHSAYNNRHSSAQDWRNFPKHIPAIVDRLRGVVIENRDYREIITKWDLEGTVIYCDPPYVHETRNSSERYAFEFTDADHRQFRELLEGVKNAWVIISGYDCPLYQELFADWQSVNRVHRTDRGTKRIETLWLSPNMPRIQPELF